ncbi:Ff.00g039850.m01.CDS01 [Fusarium sp. VM40]|nr:Ff.00g039850.m01.CDS01 [Fusarium sp. VM40]
MNPFTLFKDDGISPCEYRASVRAIEASIAPPPCECVDCQQSFYTVDKQRTPNFSYRERISDEEAKEVITAALEDIDRQQSLLRNRIETFGDLLLSRWKKHSQTKRQGLLKEAVPYLESEKWLLPRFSYTHERVQAHARRPSRRKQLMLPWLNVHVLKSNPTVLFALLQHRAFNSPQNWATFDSRQLTFGWVAGQFHVDFSAKSVIMYGNRYGSLVDWEEKAAHRGDTMGFPRAQLVLEAQAHLLKVLCSITETILSGVDPAQPPGAEKWRDLFRREAFHETSTIEFWSSYTNQAFFPPPEFDISYLLTLAKTRLDETGDNLWFLQTDTAYTRRYLKLFFATEYSKTASEDQRAVIVVKQIHGEVLSHHWWKWIEMECKHVKQEYNKFHDEIHPGTALPPSYDKALGALELLLFNQVVYRAQRLKKFVTFLPSFQKYWSFTPESKSLYATAVLKRKVPNNTKESLTEDPIDWCLMQLQLEPTDQNLFDHAMLFTMLQDHLSSNPSEKKRLDETTYQALSDLSTCHEMLLAVRLHRPQNAARTVADVRATENREPWNPRPTDRYPNDMGHLHDIGMSLVRDFYFAKQPTGPKNADWITRSQDLRAALEKFWTSIREIVTKEFRSSTFSPESIDDLIKPISAHSTAEYLKQERQTEDVIFANMHQQHDTSTLTNLFREVDIGTTSSTISRREKTKTQGGQRASAARDTENLDDAPHASSEPEKTTDTIIEVTKQSLVVFQLMYPNKDEVVKDILWDRFVHAMVDAGFVARNNSGSAVAFTQSSGEGGKIVFHKPHPVDKIDPVMLRIMAKRMTKWFGWSRELFVLRKESS